MLVEMGFSEDISTRALLKFHNNLDRAMNYLLEGGEIDSQQETVSSSISSN